MKEQKQSEQTPKPGIGRVRWAEGLGNQVEEKKPVEVRQPDENISAEFPKLITPAHVDIPGIMASEQEKTIAGQTVAGELGKINLARKVTESTVRKAMDNPLGTVQTKTEASETVSLSDKPLGKKKGLSRKKTIALISAAAIVGAGAIAGGYFYPREGNENGDSSNKTHVMDMGETFTVGPNSMVSGDVLVDGKRYFDDSANTGLIVIFEKEAKVTAPWGATVKENIADQKLMDEIVEQNIAETKRVHPEITEVDAIIYPGGNPQG